MLDLFPSEFFSEPVDHVLSRAGICSDRAFKNFLKKHRVETVSKKTGGNPVPVLDRNVLIDTDFDSILVDGSKILLPEHLYIILNKPVDAVCSRVSDSHKTVFDFLDDSVKNHPLYNHLHIAGRLDSDSRGFVFLTSNGSLSNALASPETHLSKTYSVKLKNPLSDEMKEDYKKAFAGGINLPAEKKGEAFTTKPALIEFDPEEADFCRVQIQEGKFRQIRRMFAYLGNEVSDLQRIAIGSLELPADLAEGRSIACTRL